VKSLYLAGPAGSGKTAVAVGLALKFCREGYKVSYFKPVGAGGPGGADTDAVLMKEVLSLDLPLEVIVPCEAGPSYLSRGKKLDYKKEVAAAYREVREGYDIVMVEGATFPYVMASCGMDAASLAAELGCAVVTLVRVKNDYDLDAAIYTNSYFAGKGIHLAGSIFSHVQRPLLAKTEGVYKPIMEEMGFATLGILPARLEIAAPTVAEFKDALGGEVLTGDDKMDLLVEDVVVGAMTMESALKYLRRAANKAVVLGGDRADLALAALETNTSALILTGGLYPDVKVLARASEKGVPVILVHMDTYNTIEKLGEVTRHLRPGDVRGIEVARENIEKHCDWQKILNALRD